VCGGGVPNSLRKCATFMILYCTFCTNSRFSQSLCQRRGHETNNERESVCERALCDGADGRAWMLAIA
jgi:hypothetical protein